MGAAAPCPAALRGQGARRAKGELPGAGTVGSWWREIETQLLKPPPLLLGIAARDPLAQRPSPHPSRSASAGDSGRAGPEPCTAAARWWAPGPAGPPPPGRPGTWGRSPCPLRGRRRPPRPLLRGPGREYSPTGLGGAGAGAGRGGKAPRPGANSQAPSSSTEFETTGPLGTGRLRE